MTDTVTDSCADAIRTRTATYLQQVERCLAHLPDALEAYGSDQEAFAATVEGLSTAESECDATLRELRTLVGESAPPNYTAVYLRADDLVRLYARLDEIPNCAEQFCRELWVVRPDLDPETLAALREMARVTTRATATLTEVTDAYVDSLVTPGDPVRVADDVEAIAELESRCDDRKYEALEHAFASQPAGQALVVRALVGTLDEAADAVEDAGDYVLSMNSADL